MIIHKAHTSMFYSNTWSATVWSIVVHLPHQLSRNKLISYNNIYSDNLPHKNLLQLSFPDKVEISICSNAHLKFSEKVHSQVTTSPNLEQNCKDDAQHKGCTLLNLHQCRFWPIFSSWINRLKLYSLSISKTL